MSVHDTTSAFEMLELLSSRAGLVGADNFVRLEADLHREHAAALQEICGHDVGTKVWLLRCAILFGLADAVEAVVPVMYLEEFNSYVRNSVVTTIAEVFSSRVTVEE